MPFFGGHYIFSTDREVLDVAVDVLARAIAERVTDNKSLLRNYKVSFAKVASTLEDFSEYEECGEEYVMPEYNLALSIYRG